jgi:hypothetical protein
MALERPSGAIQSWGHAGDDAASAAITAAKTRVLILGTHLPQELAHLSRE